MSFSNPCMNPCKPPRSLRMLCAEVGAIGGALTGPDRSEHSATLLSVKSVYGHTEGAAGKTSMLCCPSLYLSMNTCHLCTARSDKGPACSGLTGILMAMSALIQHALAPVASLRNMNAYVGTTLADLTAKGLTAPLPRQPAGTAHCDAQAASFGELTSDTWTFDFILPGRLPKRMEAEYRILARHLVCLLN